MVTVSFDYDADPERYRLGMHVTQAHSSVSLYDRVAALLGDLGVGLVLDVGCADGVLRAALPPSGPRLVGLDTSATLLRAHPAPVVQADAARLPFLDGSVDAVTALNVLYHLPDPLPALREAHRVLAAVISRHDSPEFSAYWTRSATSFDAEDAPDRIGRVFDSVTVYPWDAALVTLPSSAAIRDYLIGRQAPATVADTASRDLAVPLRVTKRGALILATRSQRDTSARSVERPATGDRGHDPASGRSDGLPCRTTFG